MQRPVPAGMQAAWAAQAPHTICDQEWAAVLFTEDQSAADSAAVEGLSHMEATLCPRPVLVGDVQSVRKVCPGRSDHGHDMQQRGLTAGGSCLARLP